MRSKSARINEAAHRCVMPNVNVRDETVGDVGRPFSLPRDRIVLHSSTLAGHSSHMHMSFRGSLAVGELANPARVSRVVYGMRVARVSGL